MNFHTQRRSRSLMEEKYGTMLLGGTLAMAMLSVVLISDSIISGIMLGSEAVVGVTLVTPLCSLSTFFGSLVSMGVPILFNAEMGQFHRREAERVFGMGLVLSVGMGASLFFLMTLFGNAYLQMCHPSVAELAQALRYLRWMRFSILLLPLQMLLTCMVYADGDETVSTVSSITQSLGNVAASLLLSRFLGIEGVALGSVLFYAVSLGILCTHFLKKNNSLRFSLFFSLDMLKKMLRYSAIYSSEYLFNGLLLFALSAFVGARFGMEYLILVSAVNLCRVVQVVFEGVGQAISPIVSVYLGEKCLPGVRSIYALAKKTVRWESLAITVLLLLLAPLTPVLLGITDPVMAELSIRGLRIMALTSFAVGTLYLLTAYYMLVDKILLGFLIGAFRDFLLLVPLVALMSVWLGIYGLFLGVALAPPATWLAAAAVLRVRYGQDAPLLLKQRETGAETLLYTLAASPAEITDTRDSIGEALEKRGFSDRTVKLVMLLFEEMFLLIREKNPGSRILGECVLNLEGENIRMIVRDTGVQLDLSDADMAVSSLSSYLVSTIAERISSQKQHLVTMSFNRNVFELKGERIPLSSQT